MIALKTSLPYPDNSLIFVPANALTEKSVLVRTRDPIHIRAIDPYTQEDLKIDNKDFVTITPSRVATDPVAFTAPYEGRYSCVEYIKNNNQHSIKNLKMKSYFIRSDPMNCLE